MFKEVTLTFEFISEKDRNKASSNGLSSDLHKSFAEVIEQCYSSKNKTGMRHLLKDFREMASYLPQADQELLRSKLKARGCGV